MKGKWIQKIKKNKRQLGIGVLALLLVGVMGVSLLQNSTSTVYAAESQTVVDPDTTNAWTDYIAPGGTVSTQNVGRIWTDKSVTNQDYTFTGSDNLPSIKKGNSDFIVSLSALSSTSNLKTVVKTSVPLDIVLVLDTSGSMQGQKLNSLKNAARSFISATAEENDGLDISKQSRIAIVSFASGSNVRQNLNYITNQNEQQYINSINRLTASGATYAEEGLEEAQSQFANNSRSGAKKVVIFFTDGEPNHSNGFDNEVAADAVNTAYDMKQNDVTIYAVGVMNGADASVTDDDGFNEYMNGVSSNYPDATAEGANGTWFTEGYYNTNFGQRAEGDYYKASSNASDIENIFEELSNEIQQGFGSGSPIEETINQGNTVPGSLTFRDQLGSYMHVTGIGDGEDKMQIAYADEVFTSTSKTSSGNVDTYHFEGNFEGNAIYGSASLSDLIVTVTRSDDLAVGDIVEVTIPASLIPMRHYDVDTDKSTMTVSSAYPVRLFYGVSVKEEAKNAMNDSSSDLYNEIAKTNLSKDNSTIDFYSNLYTSGNGDTTASFTPSEENKFYYYTDDTELFIDPGCTKRATSQNIGSYNTLYYSDPFWIENNGSATESNEGNTISITGLDWDSIDYDQRGNAYIPAHTHRQDRPNTLNANKKDNVTGTAGTVLSPKWTGDNSVTQYLGNNGKIYYPAAGQLEIKKSVNWGNASDTTIQNQDNFTFTVTLKDENDNELTGEFPYDIYDGDSDQPVEVNPQTMIKNGGTITLKADQRAVISNLPSGTKYTVTEEEANKNGFTTTDTSSEETNDSTDGIVTGAIVAGSQQSVSFLNEYNADDPVLLSTAGTIQVKKVLDGREWRDGDEFTFLITASSEDAAPLPKKNEVTITKGDEKDFTKAFGDIKFEKNGEYRYSINEKQGDILGVDYSTALYRVIVNVVDGGNGQLKIDSIKLDRMAKDDGTDLSNSPETINPVDKTYTATFTNKYLTDGTGTANIAGTKTYNDHSGKNPIDASKFLFKLNALGGYKTADGMSGDTYPIEAENVPMPRDEEGKIVAEAGNVVNDFTFRTINFDGNDVGNTYVYEVTEIPGSEANMSYDQTVYTVTIEVTEDTSEDPEHTGHAHINTSVSYKKTLNGVTEDTNSISFVNNYDPKEVTLGQDGAASIIGTKTLTGRNMTDQDVFNFKLTPYGNVTNTAINDGIITGIDSNGLTTTVTGPVDKDVAKEFSFGDITFKKPGAYSFLMDETDSGISNGITYDESTCVVTVTIGLDQDSGKLIVENIAYANNDNNFVNSYNATLNYGEKGGINVTKQMLDRPMKANEFAFSITGIDSINVTADEATNKLDESDKNFANIAAARDTTITMSKLQNLTFDQNDAGKTFSYIVDELEPGKNPAPGVIYDENQYQIDIEVIDNSDGTMHTVTTVTKNKGSDTEEVIVDHVNSSVEGYVAPTFGFVNDYNPTPAIVGKDADYQLTVNKTVTGAPNTDDFTFRATFNEEASTGSISDIEGLTDGSTTATITEDFNAGDSKSVDFGTLTFKAPGEYVFTVQEETTTDKSGWTYDNNPQTITIVVTDLNKDYEYDGKLYIESVTNDGVIEITNSYKSGEIIIGGEGSNQQIMVQKSVTGSNTEADFTFQLDPIVEEESKDKWNSVEAVDPNFDGTATIVDGVTTDAAKTVSFGGIKFTKEGTFEFKVSELGASDFNQGTDRQGWTYDEHESKVTIIVTDKDFDGYLEAEVSYDNSNAVTDTDREVSNAAAFTNMYNASSTGVTVPANFELTKQFIGHEWSEKYKFTFKIYPETPNAPMPANDTVTISAPNNGSKDTATFNFGGIEYTQAGTYVYKVREIVDDNVKNPGITYDTHEATVTVTVTDKDDQGSSTGQLVASASVVDEEFKNTYETGEVNYDAQAGLDIVKNMTGSEIAANQFTFTMSGKDSDSIARLNGGQEKTVNTDGKPLDGNTASETIKLSTGLVFTKDDVDKTYTYTVKENIPEGAVNNVLNGVTYDSHEYEVKFVITENGEGTLNVETFVDGVSQGITSGEISTNALPAQLVFNNSYDAGSTTVGGEGSVSINAKKVLENDDIANYNGVFKFNVVSQTNGALVSSGTNDANGTITFNPINYTTKNLNEAITSGGSNEVGEATLSHDENGNDVYKFEYTVSEDDNSLPAGITMSSGVFQITVTVTDDNQGNISAAVSYTGGATGITFVNTYGYGQSTQVTLSGNKTVTAEDGLTPPTLNGGEYQFTIEGSEGAPMPATTTVSNNGSSIAFDPITYTMENVFGNATVNMDTEETSDEVVEGETPEEEIEVQTAGRTKQFVYTITETGGSLPGVTNDTTSKVVTVTVTDNGDGTILTDVIEDANAVEGNDFTFVNTYSIDKPIDTTPTDGSVTIKKELEGQTLDADEFTFQMKDLDGNVVSEAKNDAEGNVAFGTIHFDKPETYKYTITELNGGLNGFTYDESIYYATVKVTDNGDGSLSADWTIENNAQEAIDSITFKNKYEAYPTVIQIGASKILNGKDLTDGEFTFQLVDENGDVVSEVKNNGIGSIQFDKIKYEKEGTYNYTLKEVNDNQNGITYDDTVYNVQVTVKDDQQGHLTVGTDGVVVTNDEGEVVHEIVFTNEYKEDPKGEDTSEKTDGSNTSTQTYAGLFTSLAVDAAALAGIATLLKKRNAKK